MMRGQYFAAIKATSPLYIYSRILSTAILDLSVQILTFSQNHCNTHWSVELHNWTAHRSLFDLIVILEGPTEILNF